MTKLQAILDQMKVTQAELFKLSTMMKARDYHGNGDQANGAAVMLYDWQRMLAEDIKKEENKGG